MKTILLKGTDWPWTAWVDGSDIIIENARVTCFGGGSDPQDNGETASGISTRRRPDFVGCALPMAYKGRNQRLVAALGGSPIPRVPWLTKVEFTAYDFPRTVVAEVIDLGPAKQTGNALDLTIAAARKINPHASATNFEARGLVRIIGGAHYL